MTASFTTWPLLERARRLELAAVETRRRMSALTFGVAGCEWDGEGARAFRVAADRALQTLLAAVTALEDAAEAARRLAAGHSP